MVNSGGERILERGQMNQARMAMSISALYELLHATCTHGVMFRKHNNTTFGGSFFLPCLSVLFPYLCAPTSASLRP